MIRNYKYNHFETIKHDAPQMATSIYNDSPSIKNNDAIKGTEKNERAGVADNVICLFRYLDELVKYVSEDSLKEYAKDIDSEARDEPEIWQNEQKILEVYQDLLKGKLRQFFGLSPDQILSTFYGNDEKECRHFLYRLNLILEYIPDEKILEYSESVYYKAYLNLYKEFGLA